MPRSPAITFVLRHRDRDWPDIERLDESAIDREPWRFVGGRNSWIAQTYLRLRASLETLGIEARVSDRFVPGTLCIAHKDDANEFHSEAHRSFLVIVRADRSPVGASDFTIVQNHIAPRDRERFIPLWPQPGLRPREDRRGERITTLAYFGRLASAPAWFTSTAFHRALRERGVRFEARGKGWHDYRGVDVALAARTEAATVLATKPATKLYNAWLGEVPALATPEPAYEEQRRSRLDFLAVRDDWDVVRAIDWLRADPALYRAMVENGRQRARDFTTASIREEWLALIQRELMPAYEAARSRLDTRRLWYFGGMTQQKFLSRWHRARVALERAALRPQATFAAVRRGAPDYPSPLGESAVHDFADVVR
ncbi:glycosyltransferase [Usitatibacter palustris]|uniref:Glycosyltransferase family 1 protein n=1 Tax=Usitatibacter palustris TaxID=2732487 RepID=A0A6M4H5A6_9PROT|nr:glycosyltransferase [Usitatibacter palustris]QJR13714.1 hypothetical protein DSM104440_00504 [Usitatibacter palustris]